MELKIIPTKQILANFYQPRTKFDRESIKELSESILSNGLINPITVTPDKKRKGKFMIVSGERRWQAHNMAKIKTIPCVVKDYKDKIQFKIESLTENVHREDLSSMETAKFIKEIWIDMGKPEGKQFTRRISISEASFSEHLSLVEDKTPKKVQKAVEEGKLAMRSASMIRKLPEKEQETIAKEAMKRETGIGRSEIQEMIKDFKAFNPIPEPIKYERTANDVVDDILSNLHDFKYHVDELLKEESISVNDLLKSKANKAITTAGLHLRIFTKFVNTLRQRGAKPDKNILALIRANGKN